MITPEYIRNWIDNYEPGPTGEYGRMKHKDYTFIRHAMFQNFIMKYIQNNQPCTFNQIWNNVPIKRTTCNTIVQNMARNGVIIKKKMEFNFRKQFVFYINDNY